MPIRTEDEAGVPAKPRRTRSWAAGCFGALGVLGLALWGYLAWANFVPPPPPPPAVALPRPNGYDAVLAVLPRIQSAPGGNDVNQPSQVSPARLRKAVAQQRPLLNELRAALKLPYRCPPVTSVAEDFYRPLAGYRQAARSLAAEARVAMAEGRAAEAWGSGLDALQLGSDVQRGGVVIHQLVGVAVISIGAARLDGEAGRLSAQEAQAAGARLDRIIAGLPSLAEMLAEENRVGLLYFRQAATGPPQLASEVPGEDLPWTEKARAIGLRYFYPKSWTHAALQDYYRRGVTEMRKPIWQRSPVALPGDPYLQDIAIEPTFLSNTEGRMVTHLHLLRLQLALQEYRLRHGSYPRRLQELTPVLRTIPPDPFTGKPYVYRPTPGGYLLYGVGANRVDDSGTPGLPTDPQSGDLVAGRLFPRR